MSTEELVGVRSAWSSFAKQYCPLGEVRETNRGPVVVGRSTGRVLYRAMLLRGEWFFTEVPRGH